MALLIAAFGSIAVGTHVINSGAVAAELLLLNSDTEDTAAPISRIVTTNDVGILAEMRQFGQRFARETFNGTVLSSLHLFSSAHRSCSE